MRITIVGAGYIGVSIAVLLASRHDVTLVDMDSSRMAELNELRASWCDPETEALLADIGDSVRATLDARVALRSADYVVVATPTDYDAVTGSLDVSKVVSVVELAAEMNSLATVVVKSTMPVGFADELCERFPDVRLLVSPEFLREGTALRDCLHPARIVVGIPDALRNSPDFEAAAEQFAHLLAECAEASGGSAAENVPIFIMTASEAEAVKLFSNAYLAMRVSYFNELDSFAISHGLDAAAVVKGVCADSRIGDFYNNPSFGYGGGCLPKDSMQLVSSFGKVPQALAVAIPKANEVRMRFIVDAVVTHVNAFVASGVECPVVGVYRLSMKVGVNDMRSSSVEAVIERLMAVARLREPNMRVLVYEPALFDDGSHEGGLVQATKHPVVAQLDGCEFTGDLDRLKRESDLILANRWSDELAEVAEKVFTRDLFGRD